ncbi:histidine operon leader peptide [Photorhabdus temperata]|nr:histidine operon leader peptide [Photorhabdus temperata]
MQFNHHHHHHPD